jgi:DNA helicase-2/ATP-dependent DNA helicase PcrA
VAHLLAEGTAEPHEITAVTFTNKAAREMSQRVEALVDGRLIGGFVGTFHRWALEMLRRYPAEAGLQPYFGIIDSDEQRSLINKILKQLGVDPKAHPPRLLLSRISRAVNRCQDPGDVARGMGDEVTEQVWELYRERKTSAGVVDFDDMLVLALELVRGHEVIRRAVRRRGRWLLVDEFQDTNRLQMELLSAIVPGGGNITAVGDEDQSIYGWRGAEMDNILSFERHFPGAEVVAMEENYRSTRPILAAAGALIAHNNQRRGKKLFTSQDGGNDVLLFVGADERAETRWVSDQFEELAVEHGFGRMAVLVRTNAQTRPFEEELTRRRIPHRVIGGLRFWQRAEVRDALAYLRLVVRSDDVLAFERVVNTPARGIGAATMDVLQSHARATGLPLPAAARQIPDQLAPRARVALERFFEIFSKAAEQRDALEPGDFVGWMLEASGLLAQYEGDDEERVARRENLQQLAAAVAEAATRGQELAEFLDAVALYEDGDEATGEDAVSLMTLHAAKGLEFDVVVLAGLEDGLLPHANSHDEPDRLEEERRLAYVGMTRARKKLTISFAANRMMYGRWSTSIPSRFVEELPDAHVDHLYRNPATRPDTSLFFDDAPYMRTSRMRGNGRASRAPTIDGNATLISSKPGGSHKFSTHDRIFHEKFGYGEIAHIEGDKLTINFEKAGQKKVVASFVKPANEVS